MLRYIELKSGFTDDGPAWIARVQASRSGRTIYFNGKALKQSQRGIFIDMETGDRYWVSGVKKDGTDRHRFGSGKVMIEADAIAEYLAEIGATTLDTKRLQPTTAIVQTDISKFAGLENESLGV